jgi:hypothetical protein
MKGQLMTKRSILAIVGTIITIAGLAAASEVQTGADQVAFPENYANGVVYLTIDRPQNKQVTAYYASQEAIEAATKGMPLPSGTVIAAVAFSAQLDEQGNPLKDAGGRFIKTNNIQGYRVMEKRAGWGTDYPEAKRNGDWEYQVFRADKSVNPTADLNACFNCHKPQDKQDFVFTYDKLKAATR